VRSDLVRLALEYQIRPERRSDELDAVDPDGPRVEEVDPGTGALLGDLYPRLVDLRTVELVVSEHVHNVRGARPALPDALDETRARFAENLPICCPQAL